MNIGQVMLSLRKERGVSQLQLGAALGINDTGVSKMEKGTRTPSITQIEKAAEFFGVTPSYLMALADGSISKLAEVVRLITEIEEFENFELTTEERLATAWEIIGANPDAPASKNLVRMVLKHHKP